MGQSQDHTTLHNKWIHLIKACQTSTLTVAAFARENNIGEASLYNWSKRLGLPLKHKPQAEGQPEISFVVLNPRQPPEPDDVISVRHPQEQDDALDHPRDIPKQDVALSPQHLPKQGHLKQEASPPEAYPITVGTPHLNITMCVPWPHIVALIKTLS